MRATRGMWEFGGKVKPKLDNPRILKQKHKLVGKIKILNKLLKGVIP
jgi:hypothetical protein